MAYTLAAQERTVRGERVRAEGVVPAVIYGAGDKTVSLSLNPVEFLKLYKAAGESSLIDLTINGKDAGKVLVHEVQYEPVKGTIIHVDFRRIDMNKVMRAPVELRFVGEAPVVKASGGTLVTNLTTIEIECLPKDLVSHIDVDLSGLNSYDDVIKVKDLHLPAGMKVVSPNEDDLVAKAAPALTEEQIKAMEEASTAQVDLSQIEVAGKKKEEEAAEGEAAEGEKKEPAKKEEKK